MVYGIEQLIDLKGCDPALFTREHIEAYLIKLCDLIDMKRCLLVFWDDFDVPEEERQTESHLKGTSAVQFILTSHIVVHTLDLLGEAYITISSCKPFDEYAAASYTRSFFGGNFQPDHEGWQWRILKRGPESAA